MLIRLHNRYFKHYKRNSMKKILNINLYAYGNAAENYDCEQGPSVLKNALEKTPAAQNCRWGAPLQVNNRHQQRVALTDVAALSKQLAQSTHDSVQNKQCFITLGGDHTAAIGSWSGAANALSGDLGLIWFDAHMDSHTFETTPSNNIHGMPLAVLLGHGESVLTHIASNKPKLKPEQVVLIGVRSYEPGEAALLKKLGVKIFYMTDIKKMGMERVIASAVEIVTKNTVGFGISIDLDGFDPVDAPGVGTSEADGIHATEFLNYFSLIAQHPKLIGADIVEFNPVLDRENKTEKLSAALFEALVK